MTASGPQTPDRFRLLATHLAGRSVDVCPARAGEAAHTDGHVIFVSADAGFADQRREVLVQSALLGAGSLDRRLVKSLGARPSVARRYLALEGRRALAALEDQVPLAMALCPDARPSTATADESLAWARSRADVAEAPTWFGVIRPSRLLASPAAAGTGSPGRGLPPESDLAGLPEDDDDEDDERSAPSKILKLFDNPLFSSRSLSNYLRKMFGTSRSPGEQAAGAELTVRSIRRAAAAGPDARPLPTRIRFGDKGRPGAAAVAGGTRYPEWDVFNGRYRPDWCRVLDSPLSTAADVTSAAGVARDDVLRRRLSRLGLGPEVLRGRADGDELDLEALVDLFVDLRSGYSPPEHVYTERRKSARNLGVLILVDASGSATDTDPEGLAVHDHQRRAAATLAATLEELGDRVAVYAFRSQGRHAVAMPVIKTFGQRFGALGRARLGGLQPSGYTRLGAGIRGAGQILKTEAGTPNRLLLVLSDGFPYDDGYEGRYAESDANKALEELRADGIACLCLSIGAAAQPEVLERVFGSASHVGAATLADLSPRMDEWFLCALAELAAPKPARR